MIKQEKSLLLKIKEKIHNNRKGVKSMDELKQRIIQEFVPGKQVTIDHVIANPKKDIYTKLGITEETNWQVLWWQL